MQETMDRIAICIINWWEVLYSLLDSSLSLSLLIFKLGVSILIIS